MRYNLFYLGLILAALLAVAKGEPVTGGSKGLARSAVPGEDDDNDTPQHQQQQQQQQQQQKEMCLLAEQIRQCVAHSSMQKSICTSDDFDCQCTWASKITTCYAPCLSEKSYMETMQAAKQQESVVCGQASKFGKLAKEKEKLKSESTKSKSGSATSKSESSATSTPKDINDLNSDHDLPSNTHTSMDDAGSRPKNPHAHGGAKTANSGNENKLKYARLPPPTGDDMRIAASASGQLEASSAGVAALALALAIVSML